MFDFFLKPYASFVIKLKNNLISVDQNLFNSINSRLDLYKGFTPENDIERAVSFLGVIILIPIACLLPLIFIFPIIPFFNKYVQPENNLIIFVLGMIWFLTFYISLMVIFLTIALVFFSIFLIYFGSLFSKKPIPFSYYLNFSWYYANFVLLEFLNIIFHFKTLLPIILLIVAEILGIIIANLIIFFLIPGGPFK